MTPYNSISIFHFTFTIISISTAESIGNSFTPTALRTCLPASPKIFPRSSEAPFATFGWSVNPSALLTNTVTFIIFSILSKSFITPFIALNPFSAQISAAFCPSWTVRSKPIFPAYFIANTNRVEGIDKALRTRFNFQLNFKEIQPETAFAYLLSVLDREGVQYDRDKVWEFTFNNINKGLRDLVNNLEINVSTIDGVKTLGGISEFQSSNNNEEYVLELINFIIKTTENLDNTKITAMLREVTAETSISQYYKAIIDSTKNDPNLDYDFIFNKMLEAEFSLDVKNIIMENYQDIDLKKFPNLHLMSTINKCFLTIGLRKGL